MKRFLMSFILILTLTCVLISCADNSGDAPEGLQIVKASESEGYVFYGPEGWAVANDGKIAASYIALNNTSITFTEAQMPSGSFEEYFEEYKSQYPYDITVKSEGPTAFGNAESAYSVLYTFKYSETDISCLQIFVKNAGAFYIFTYTSAGDPDDENSDYARYFESVRLAIENFKFTTKSPVSDDSNGYELDGDGYALVSDKELSGFELYLPSDSEVVISSTIVTAKLSDKANITITKAANAGVGVIQYLWERKEKIESLFGEVTDVKLEIESLEPIKDAAKEEITNHFDTELVANPDITFGNLEKNNIIVYEYTYNHGGSTYHVYQVLGIEPGVFGMFGGAGYVFTYTATEDEYNNHLETIEKILQKLRF